MVSRGSGGKDPLILNFANNWRWVISFTSRPLYPLYLHVNRSRSFTVLLIYSTEQSPSWEANRSSASQINWCSRTLRICDISLGLLTLSAPEAGDFVELILLYLSMFRQHGFFFADFNWTTAVFMSYPALIIKKIWSPCVQVMYTALLTYSMEQSPS